MVLSTHIYLSRFISSYYGSWSHSNIKRKNGKDTIKDELCRSVTGKEHKVQFEAEPMLNDTYTTAVEDFDSGSNNKIINQASELYKNINIGVEYIRGQI